MNEAEFNDFRQELATSFPTVLAWFRRLPKPAQDKQRGNWWAILKVFELDEVLEAIEAISLGQADPIGEYDRHRERIALHLRSVMLARRSKERGDVPEYVNYEEAKRLARNGWQGGFERYLELTDAGLDAREAVVEAFGPDNGDGDRREAKKCQTCRDQGMVYVWHRDAIRAVLDGTFDDRPEVHTIGAIPCTCSKGDGRGGGSEKGVGRYDFEKWCPCPKGDIHDAQNLADLKSWVAAQVDYARQKLGDRQNEMFAP